MRAMRSASFSELRLFAKALDQQRKGQRGRALYCVQVQRAAVDLAQRQFQTLQVQFLTQDFLFGLGQQHVVSVVLLEHLEEQPAGCLQLTIALGRARVAGKHQPGDARDFLKRRRPVRQRSGWR